MNDELRAAAQSSLLFSFQLALPNGRADENKEEKKGLAALFVLRMENFWNEMKKVWNEQ